MVNKKNKPPVDVKYALNWWFSNYLKWKVEWKSFDGIKFNWIYLKLFITSYKEKNLKKSLSYYKKLPKEYPIFASKTYPKVHKWIQKHILYRIMKNKWDMIKFLKFWIRNYLILIWENEKEVLLSYLYLYPKV